MSEQCPTDSTLNIDVRATKAAGGFVQNFRLPNVLVWSGLSSSHPFRNRKLYAVYWYLIIYKHSNFVYRTTRGNKNTYISFLDVFLNVGIRRAHISDFFTLSRREGSREENETWLPGYLSYGDLYMFVYQVIQWPWWWVQVTFWNGELVTSHYLGINRSWMESPGLFNLYMTKIVDCVQLRSQDIWTHDPYHIILNTGLDETTQELTGGFIFFKFSPLLGEMIQFDEHIFQMGWNHQPDKLYSGESANVEGPGIFGRLRVSWIHWIKWIK